MRYEEENLKTFSFEGHPIRAASTPRGFVMLMDDVLAVAQASGLRSPPHPTALPPGFTVRLYLREREELAVGVTAACIMMNAHCSNVEVCRSFFAWADGDFLSAAQKAWRAAEHGGLKGRIYDAVRRRGSLSISELTHLTQGVDAAARREAIEELQREGAVLVSTIQPTGPGRPATLVSLVQRNAHPEG